MLDLADLRARWDALPLDRAPLRRAGLLSILLVALLVLGKAFGPDRSAASAPAASRNQAPTATERVSEPARGWTGGRIVAVVLLVAGVGGALVLRKRSGPATGASSEIDVLETLALGTGQTLKLIACGGEVLLVSATEQSVQLLRQWPRERFDRTPPSFADVLASVGPSAESTDISAQALPASDATPPRAEVPPHAVPEADVPAALPPAPVESPVAVRVDEEIAAVPTLAVVAPRAVAAWPSRARRTLHQFGAADA